MSRTALHGGAELFCILPIKGDCRLHYLLNLLTIFVREMRKIANVTIA